MNRVFDVEQNAIAGARTRREADRRIHRDVVALVGVRRLLDRLGCVFAVAAAIVQTVQRAGSRVNKDAGAGDDLRILRRGYWNFYDINAKERRVWILVRRFARTPGEFFRLTYERRAGDVDINVVFVVGVHYQRMRVRTA